MVHIGTTQLIAPMTLNMIHRLVRTHYVRTYYSHTTPTHYISWIHLKIIYHYLLADSLSSSPYGPWKNLVESLHFLVSGSKEDSCSCFHSLTMSMFDCHLYFTSSSSSSPSPSPSSVFLSFSFLFSDEASCMRMVHEYYTSTAGQFDFLVHYLNETPARGNFISDIYHHPCMAVLELLRGKCPPNSLTFHPLLSLLSDTFSTFCYTPIHSFPFHPHPFYHSISYSSPVPFLFFHPLTTQLHNTLPQSLVQTSTSSAMTALRVRALFAL